LARILYSSPATWNSIPTSLKIVSPYSGPEVLFKTCVAMKFVDNDDDDDDDDDDTVSSAISSHTS